MEIRPSVRGGERRRTYVSILIATTALTAAGLALALTADTALADDWTGTVSSEWDNPGNWADGSVPTATDEVRIDNGSRTSFTILASPGAVSGDVQLGDSGISMLQIVSGGTLTSANVNIGNTGAADGTGYVIGSGSRWISDIFTVGQAGRGMLTVSGGGVVRDVAGNIANGSGSHGFMEITGAGSQWISDEGTSIGFSGSGQIRISNGGLVTTGTNGYLGRLADGSGRVIVQDPGSTWTIADDLFIGDGGRGKVMIKDGGAVSDRNGFIGKEDGTVGEEGFVGIAAVTGPGSTWTNTGNLFVGSLGSGRLSIENGGDVSNKFGYIGGEGSTGTATVTGTGSNWTSSRTLFVGQDGQGILSVEGGGAVDSASGVIGARATGAATIAGSSSTWSISNGLTVGSESDGTLSVEDGGAVDSKYSYIGSEAGSTGAATVTGAHSAWTTTYGLTVGDSGNGALTVEHGGAIESKYGFIGAAAGSVGAATVTGLGSNWTMSDEMYVGQGGRGTLIVEGGGAVVAANGYIGKEDGSAGEVIVSGGDSELANSGALLIGEHGTGTLTVENGAAVTTSGIAAVGRDAGGVGTATVTGRGSTWTVDNFFLVGNLENGQGSLSIESGGKLVTNSQVRIGEDDETRGTVLVTGTGSKWVSAPDQFHVGFSGEGSLTIADAGEVGGARHATIGTSAGSSGTVIVTGAGSAWNNTATGDLHIGDRGTGLLVVENGAAVTSGDSYIGTEAGAVGEVNVTGLGSNWTMSDEMYVGQTGEGALTVAAGGKVANTTGYIGYEIGSTGEVTVTGPGSSWVNSGAVSVGIYGNGTLTIGDGGVVAGTDSVLGDVTGSNGKATVTGTNSKWTSSNGLSVGLGGRGSLTIAAGGTVEDADGIIGNAAASTGSTVTVTGADSVWRNSANLTVGLLGSGALTIEGGGAVTDISAYLGSVAGSQGTATVTGETSAWTNSSELSVGYSGIGGLSIKDHGQVTNTEGYIGRLAGSRGTVTVAGEGSTWSNSGPLRIGYFGVGTLTVKDGGTVSDTRGYIGYGLASGPSSVTVAGAGSSWANSEYLSVGDRGTGLLTIANGGQVTSAGAYLGRFTGGKGTLTVAGAGSRWNTSATVRVGDQGRGEVTVADGGSVGPAGFYVAAEAGSEGVVNIGAAAGDAPQAPGTLEGRVRFGSGDGSLVFNHTATSYLFSPEIVGSGQIDLLAGTTELNDAGGFSGTTSVNSGATLVANGALGGALDVHADGRLKGSGTVGSANIAGTVAPGNSIGTLHVAGSYTQAAGSTYEVEVDAAGNSDSIDVSGTATLNGGTIRVIPFPDFALTTPYTILTAAGGVTGTFDGVSGGFASAFLSPELTYHANDVTFAIAQTASFSSAALTPNQRAAAEGADSTGPGNPVWNAIATLASTADAPAAFDAISGEVHASAKSVLIEDSRFLREAIDARLRAAFAGVGANTSPVHAYGEGGSRDAPADTDLFAVWGHAFGSWGEWDSDGNAAALSRDTGGFVFGGDAAVGESWRLGLLAGYSHTSLDVEDRASSGSVDSYHLGAYAGTELGNFGLRFGGAYSWHDIETARSATFPGFRDSLSADYHAATAQVFGEAGYRIDTSHASFEPFANLAYVNLHTDGFTGKGGAAALTAASASEDTTFTTLGLRAEAELPVGGMAAKIHGMLGWRHAFGDTVPTANLAFAGSSVFTVVGVPIAEDAAVVEAGIDLALGANANLGIAYNGQIGEGMQDHGLKARFAMTF